MAIFMSHDWFPQPIAESSPRIMACGGSLQVPLCSAQSSTKTRAVMFCWKYVRAAFSSA